MGSGSTQWSSGAGTNAASFGVQSLFGTHLAAAPATTTATKASGTKGLGYQDLTKATRRGAHQAPMTAAAPQAGGRQLNATEDFDTNGPILDTAEAGTNAAIEHFGPPSPEEDEARQLSRSASMRQGMAEAKPAGPFGDVAEDA